MKTLEDLLIVTEHGIEIVPSGSIITEADDDIIDIDPGSLEADPQPSMQELSKKVEKWLVIAKADKEAGILSENGWNHVTEMLTGLLKLIHSGDKEGIVTRLEALKANNDGSRLSNTIIKLYSDIAGQLGSFPIMQNRIFNRECIESISAMILEALDYIDEHKLLYS
jgi:hypothetical protein